MGKIKALAQKMRSKYKFALMSAFAVMAMAIPALATDATPTPVEVDLTAVTNAYVSAYGGAASAVLSSAGPVVGAVAALIALGFFIRWIPRIANAGGRRG